MTTDLLSHSAVRYHTVGRAGSALSCRFGIGTAIRLGRPIVAIGENVLARKAFSVPRRGSKVFVAIHQDLKFRTMTRPAVRLLVSFILVLLRPFSVHSSDWPQWRYDHQRGGVVDRPLPENLRLQWTRTLPRPQPAWPRTQPDLQFDVAPSPIVSRGLVLVGSTTNDNLSAYRIESGQLAWQFQADGPVRFAAAADSKRAYFVSDDGYLYAVELESGKLAWRVRGGPANQLNLGNQRMISAWPARGAPVVESGRVYFAASIWPFMGVFIHCVDAVSGQSIWVNSGDGTNWTIQPHGAPAFATVAPQGYLCISGQHLLVPGGRSVPAAYDKRTGKLVHFLYEGKRGHYSVFATGEHYFVDGGTHQTMTGKRLVNETPVLADSRKLVFVTPNQLRFQSVSSEVRSVTTRDRRGRQKTSYQVKRDLLASYELSHPVGRVLFMAGDQVWTTRNGKIFCYRPGEQADRIESPVPTISASDEPIWDAIPAEGRLVVVTRNGKLMVYGEGAGRDALESRDSLVRALDESAPTLIKPATSPPAHRIHDRLSHGPDGSSGYVLVLGIGSGQLIQRILRETELQVVVVEADREKANRWRRRWQEQAVHGNRVAICLGRLETLGLPPYFANRIVTEYGRYSDLMELVESPEGDEWWSVLMSSLRPYGGSLLATFDLPTRKRLVKLHENWIRRIDFPESQTARSQFVWSTDALSDPASPDGPCVRRSGKLPNTDDWSHQYGNVAQAGINSDELVKAPLGILWFGGPSNEGILPRHGHGPTPQAAGGRLVIEGADQLRCLDIYTGRLLWERQLPGLGLYYNTTRHFPGAGEVGANYVTLPDHIYVAYRNRLLELDATTGKTTRTYLVDVEGTPGLPDSSWGYIGVWQNLLVATREPVVVKNDNVFAESHARQGMSTGKLAVVRAESKWQTDFGDAPTASQDRPDIVQKLKTWANVGHGDSNWVEVSLPSAYKKWLSNAASGSKQLILRRQFDLGTWAEFESLQLWVQGKCRFTAFINGQLVCQSTDPSTKTDTPYRAIALGEMTEFPLKSSNVLMLVLSRDRVAVQESEDAIELDVADRRADQSVDGKQREPFRIQLVAIERDSDTGAVESASANADRDANQPKTVAQELATVPYASSSRRLIVFDRHSGEQLWEREANYNFRHNCISIGGGRIYCIDWLTEAKHRALQRRGVQISDEPRLYAFDASTGRVIWQRNDGVFGTFVNYSSGFDILVQGGSVYRDRAYDEAAKGIAAYRGRDGQLIWKQPELVYGGPCLLWRDKILTNGKGGFAIELKTGDRTGWSYERHYGCNTAHGCDNMLTFRSGAAGFYDLQHDSGTANLGGFRSSCTNNLIPANGVLAAPDYTRTCNCAYQNQTSLALVHRPESEFWTFGGRPMAGRLGLNFGAPGDRRAAQGTLWQEFPEASGVSPLTKSVRLVPESPDTFRLHSALVGGPTPWISSSGLVGVRRIVISGLDEPVYRLKMFFMEPATEHSTERCFNVKLQGRPWLSEFCPSKSAGAARRGVERSTWVEPARGEIRVDLEPLGSGRRIDSQRESLLATAAVVSGIELIAVTVPKAGSSIEKNECK